MNIMEQKDKKEFENQIQEHIANKTKELYVKCIQSGVDFKAYSYLVTHITDNPLVYERAKQDDSVMLLCKSYPIRFFLTLGASYALFKEVEHYGMYEKAIKDGITIDCKMLDNLNFLDFLIEAGHRNYSTLTFNILEILKNNNIKLSFIEKNSKNQNFITQAASLNKQELAIKLLEFTSSENIINEQDYLGNTALHYAFIFGQEKLAAALLTKGASYKILNLGKFRPFDMEINHEMYKHHFNFAKINPARSISAHLNSIFSGDNFKLKCIDNSLLEKLGLHPKNSLANKQNAEKVLLLLGNNLLFEDSKNSQISAQRQFFYKQYYSSFSSITVEEQVEQDRKKLKNKIFELPNVNKNLVLRLFADSGLKEGAELAIKAGADINSQGVPSGKTALHIAALKNNIEIYNWLVSNGANETIKDNNGKTPKTYLETKKAETSQQNSIPSADIEILMALTKMFDFIQK